MNSQNQLYHQKSIVKQTNTVDMKHLGYNVAQCAVFFDVIEVLRQLLII